MKGRKIRIAVAIASAVALAGVTMAVPAGAATDTVTVKEAQHVCSKPKRGHGSCDAMRVIYKRVRKGSVEALNAAAHPTVAPSLANGPVGGYSPAQIAKAYNLNADATAAANQTVAIVDAYKDPNLLSDLNHFDDQYGLPHETGSTFQVVGQTGGSQPSTTDTGWGEEQTLDVDAVRGLCHQCKILMIETNDNSIVNLAAGAAEAATLHATEISNSYGWEEDATSSSTVISAYDHSGIPITASTGDDGFYDWDFANQNETTPGMSNAPASYRTVVGVGGTSLFLNPDGGRAGETAWNENGPGDIDGFNLSASMGAAGSGCSAIFAAKPWQQNTTGYSGLGCGAGKRSEVDITAIADPYTGFDIYDSFGEPGWLTLGGTSLAAPAIAAMFALSGGGHGITYPSLTLYGHLKSDSSKVNDIKIGGTGLCGSMPTAQCFNFLGANPNTFGFSSGPIDCGFAMSPDDASSILTNKSQCNAVSGFDGVSGVGTPNGLTVFAKMTPKAVISGPSTAVHGHTATWSSSTSTDPFPGGTISGHSWNWGDGHTSTGTSVAHTYSAKGTFTITLTVTDSYGVASTAVTKQVTIS